MLCHSAGQTMAPVKPATDISRFAVQLRQEPPASCGSVARGGTYVSRRQQTSADVRAGHRYPEIRAAHAPGAPRLLRLCGRASAN